VFGVCGGGCRGGVRIVVWGGAGGGVAGWLGGWGACFWGLVLVGGGVPSTFYTSLRNTI